MGPSVPPQSQPGAALTPLAADPILCLNGTITHLRCFLLNEADLLGETWPGSVLACLGLCPDGTGWPDEFP